MIGEPPGGEEIGLHGVDADASALGSIFFEDGMTYLRLGDLHSACEMLQRAVESDPTQGLYLAYYAYSVFRRDQGGVDVREMANRQLQEALRISPSDSDVYLIIARFYLKCSDIGAAEQAIERAKILNANNPNLTGVERALERGRAKAR